MMATLDLVQRIADRVKEVPVRCQDRAIGLEFNGGLRAVEGCKNESGVTIEKARQHVLPL